MSVLCANNTHVYRANPSTSSGGAATRCDCGAQANNPPMSGYTFPEILERYFPNQMDICPVCDRPEIEHTVHPNGDTECPIRLPDFPAWDALSDEALFNFEHYCDTTNENVPPSSIPGAYPAGSLGCTANYHVWLWGTTDSNRMFPHSGQFCACGTEQWVSQAATPPGPYGLLANYNPHHPRMQPPVAEPAIPASVKAKAIEAGASHVSSDGKQAYAIRMDSALVCFWDDETREFGTWFHYLVKMPAEAVEVK